MECPHCQRLLYSRQQKVCGYCGKELPEGVRFSQSRIGQIKGEMEASEKRHSMDDPRGNDSLWTKDVGHPGQYF